MEPTTVTDTSIVKVEPEEETSEQFLEESSNFEKPEGYRQTSVKRESLEVCVKEEGYTFYEFERSLPEINFETRDSGNNSGIKLETNDTEGFCACRQPLQINENEIKIEEALINYDEEEIEMKSKIHGLRATSQSEDGSTAMHKSRFDEAAPANGRCRVVNAAETELEVFLCAACSYFTKSRAFMSRHIKGHNARSRSKVYSCQCCPYKTLESGVFNRHQLGHKPKSAAGWFKCAQCLFSSKWKSNILRHTSVHKARRQKCLHGSSSELRECKKCLSTSGSGMRDHHSLCKVKSRVKFYKCKDCPFTSKWAIQHRSHMLTHGAVLPPYECDECSYTVRDGKLDRHMLVHKSVNLRTARR